MLLDLEFARLPTDPTKKVVLTSDRDEHIRITRYPQGHIIEGYLLGHTQFVNNICVIQGSSDLAVSGGGDGELKLWKWWSEKKEIGSLNLNSVLGNEGEDGTTDRTVKGIWQIGEGGKIAVAIEKVAKLLIFDVTDAGFKILGNIDLKGNALSTAFDLKKSVAFVSIDPEQEGTVALQKISLENFQIVEDEQVQTINNVTATKDEGYKAPWGELYKAKVLRKFEGEEGGN
jgi:tRNA (guanine-N(7)-)-methyltransferase subunit TRM82